MVKKCQKSRLKTVEICQKSGLTNRCVLRQIPCRLICKAKQATRHFCGSLFKFWIILCFVYESPLCVRRLNHIHKALEGGHIQLVVVWAGVAFKRINIFVELVVTIVFILRCRFQISI